MIGAGNRSSRIFSLVLGSGAPLTNGGSGRKRIPGRTKIATGSRKRTIGLVLSGVTGNTSTTDQFGPGRTSGAFVGTIGEARGTRGSRTTTWTIACV